jgi:hypothetical protein
MPQFSSSDTGSLAAAIAAWLANGHVITALFTVTAR